MIPIIRRQLSWTTGEIMSQLLSILHLHLILFPSLYFIPKSLFQQFRRVANIYFLVVACVSFSPLAPFSSLSILAPLIVVIGATMAKEGVEDWRRRKQVILEINFICRANLDLESCRYLGLSILYVDTLVINYNTLRYIFVKFWVTSIVKRLCIGSNKFRLNRYADIIRSVLRNWVIGIVVINFI